MAELTIQSPQGRLRKHQLSDEPVVLGRDPGCDIPLEDLGASRRHVEIKFNGDHYVLTDLGSKNGTLVNNLATRTTRLHDGDAILIGSVHVIFHDGEHKSTETTIIVDEDAGAGRSTTYKAFAEQAELSHRRLEILYELTDRLTRLRDRDELLNDAMDVCFEMLRFERGAIAVRQQRGNDVDWAAVRNLRGSEGEMRISSTLLRSALTYGERVIVTDAGGAGNIDPTVSMVQHNIRSAMCVPLLSGEKNFGVIYGDRVSSGTTYSKEDIDFLAGIATLVTTGLINAQLMEEQTIKATLESEMGMAREIQNGLFPPALPERPDLCVGALNLPGFHVSGDYYDFVERPNGQMAMLIADVTGEGIAAALLMANLQAAVRLTLPTETPLPDLLNQWNRLICSNTEASRFITMMIGIIDPKKRTMEMGLAGHHPPQLVRSNGAWLTLESEPDYPLGVIDDCEYSTRVCPLGDEPCTIVTYTDGVIEAVGDDGEMYGTPRVGPLLAGTGTLDPQVLVDRLQDDVKRHAGTQAQGDDITIIALNLR